MRLVTEAQIIFGKRLGLDLSGKPVGEAKAMIFDVIERDFHGTTDLGTPTPKQIALAAKFQRDIAGATRRVGDAVINDLMIDLNYQAIEREKLAPGVVVINRHDPLRKRHVISSINDDGTVYFRGGQGKKAWARSLIRNDDD
jgi:hypothetical protein